MAPDPIAIELNVDAALALQAAVGIDAYPLVLALLPIIPDWDDQRRANVLIAEELTRAGIVSEDGEVNPNVEHWLHCLHRPDVELAMRVVRPTGGQGNNQVLRMSLVRSAGTHVLAVRNADRIVIQSVFSVPGQLDALSAAVLAAMGQCLPAPFVPWTAPREQVAEISTIEPDEVRRVWRELGADGTCARILTESEVVQSSEIVAYEYHDGVLAEPEHFVRIIDTADGRLVVSPKRSAGDMVWLSYAPGDKAAVHLAISDLIALSPAGSWFDTARATEPS